MRRLLGLLTIAGLIAASSPAEAKLLEIYAQVGAGGGTGKGTSGEQKEADFFSNAAGFGYGALVGVEIIVIDVWVSHTQFVSEGSVHGTWTAFMLGGDAGIELNDDGKLELELGGGVGFGVGTGQQIEPPLDNSEITDKGLLLTASAGLNYQATKNLAFGVTLPVTWSYMTKNGPGIAINDEDNVYQAVSFVPMAYLRFSIAPFSK